MARMLPVEAELVSEWPGMPGREKSVKRFERSNWLDTALYKNIPFLIIIMHLKSSLYPGKILCRGTEKSLNKSNMR